jgi:hypothetical protein
VGELKSIPPENITTQEWTECLVKVRKLRTILKLRTALSARLARLNREIRVLEKELDQEREYLLLRLEAGAAIENNASCK